MPSYSAEEHVDCYEDDELLFSKMGIWEAKAAFLTT